MTTRSENWKTRFAGTVPKDRAFSDSNEDKLRTCDVSHVYALSDGASESFNSALWAEILVDRSLKDLPRPHRGYLRWLRTAMGEYEERSKREGMSWSQEAAFARGSFASLLVVQLTNAGFVITAIGDTVALLVEGGAILRSFPYTEADQFRDRPHLVSTLMSRHTTPFFREALRSLVSAHRQDSLSRCRMTWPYPESEGAQLLCVTDALGEWLLRKDELAQIRLAHLLAVASQEEFLWLVEDARENDGLRQDDTTLLVLGDEHAAPNL
jgi:hypothetical protein